MSPASRSARSGGAVQHVAWFPMLAVLVLAGCGHTKSTAIRTQEQPSMSRSHGTRSTPAPKLQHPSQRYVEALILDGHVLSTASREQGISDYKGLSIGLVVEGVGIDDLYGPAVVGNHAQILSSRVVQTAKGRTYEALSEQTAPAAAASGAVQYHYWLVVYREAPTPQYPSQVLAYCIVATPRDGKPSLKDQAVVLSLLPDWQVPAAR